MFSKNTLPLLPDEKHAKKGALRCALIGWGQILCTIGQTLLIAVVLDRALKGDTRFADIGMAFGGLILVRMALSGLGRKVGFRAAADCRTETRVALLDSILRKGPLAAPGRRTGAWVHDAVEGVEALDAYYGFFLPQFFVGLSAPILICGAIAVMDPVTGGLLLLTAPLAPLLLGLTQSRFRSVSQQYRAAAKHLSAQFLDSIQGLTTLKMFNRGKDQGRKIRDWSESFRKETMKLLAVNQLAIFLLDWGFALCATAAAFGIAVWRWKAGALSAGEAVAVVLLSVEIVRQLNLLGAFFFAGAGGRLMIRKIRDRLSELPKSESAKSLNLSEVPRLSFQDVDFRYDEEIPVLRDVSFTVQPGETVGIVGPSGAGKSTLIPLLLRFVEPRSGAIRLDGQNLQDLPVEAVREKIAVVSQQTWLFHGTVAENLRIAKADAIAEELEYAARLAGLHDFIISLPQGYETPLGEQGARLSGGQAQRLSMARALLKDAPIIILDEPTSHLDAIGEDIITEALAGLETRTVIHITHRLRALRHATRLFTMEEGRLTENRTSDLISAS